MRPAVLFLLPFLALPALARPPGPPPHRPPPPHEILAKHADDLGIDDAIVEEARQIAEAARPELDALHDQARAAMDKVHEREEQVMDEVLDLLTPEQQAKLEALKPAGPPPHRPPPPAER